MGYFVLFHRCSCGNCIAMPTSVESVCCREVSKVEEYMDEAKVECMTVHEGFIGACLNRYVVEMSLYAYVQDVSPVDDNEPLHKLVFRFKINICKKSENATKVFILAIYDQFILRIKYSPMCF